MTSTPASCTTPTATPTAARPPPAATPCCSGSDDNGNVFVNTDPGLITHSITLDTALGAGLLVVDGAVPVRFASSVTVNGSGGADVVNINSTLAGVPVTVNAGLGNETIYVGGESRPAAGYRHGQRRRRHRHGQRERPGRAEGYLHHLPAHRRRDRLRRVELLGDRGLIVGTSGLSDTINVNSTTGVTLTLNAARATTRSTSTAPPPACR